MALDERSEPVSHPHWLLRTYREVRRQSIQLYFQSASIAIWLSVVLLSREGTAISRGRIVVFAIVVFAVDGVAAGLEVAAPEVDEGGDSVKEWDQHHNRRVKNGEIGAHAGVSARSTIWPGFISSVIEVAML